jgi:uncharacterized membrane protein YgaE (UPF0421/DUF939 family)
MIFWILAIIATCAVTFKCFGKSGLQSALLLCGLLLTKDVILHFWGPVAEYIYTGLVVALALVIYIIQRKNRDRQNQHEHHHKQHEENPVQKDD